jgi:3-oxoacyl-[acyl-carrier-protein] synthase II
MTPIHTRRVVVTGLGAITPLGKTTSSSWASLVKGESGIGPITLIETMDQLCKIAGEVKHFNPEDYLDKKDARRMDRFMQFALVAAQEAYTDAGLTPENVDPERFSVVIGSASGGVRAIESSLHDVLEKGFRRLTPFFVPMMLSDLAAGRVSIALNAQGPNYSVVTACATGTDSIGSAYKMIQYGETDVAVAGGAEAAITPLSVAGFASARALSLRNHDPEKASRPFDKDRDGFVIAEGSCLLILEEREHALKRGAKIYGEIIGYARTSDAYDIVSPSPEGTGAKKSMELALKQAQISPDKVQYINAHATSTPVGDLCETRAILSVFGEHASTGKVLVGSTKSMTGHLLGAAGSLEAAICLLAMQNQILPPTINVDNQDPECPLDVVANTARAMPADFEVSMSNSFGFGGHNATLIFRKTSA